MDIRVIKKSMMLEYADDSRKSLIPIKHYNDHTDYNKDWPIYKRVSARGIVQKDDKFLMIHISDADYYSFPGGGIEHNESCMEALLREMLEETGYTVDINSASAYGSAVSLHNNYPFSGKKEIYIGIALYFKVSLLSGVARVEPQLTRSEKRRGLEIVEISIKDAFEHNNEIIKMHNEGIKSLPIYTLDFVLREQAIISDIYHNKI